MKKIVLGLSVGLVAFNLAQAATYELDKSHATIGFSVRHMVVSNVKGFFSDFSGTVEYDEADPSQTKAAAKIIVNSINTANEDRDKHLRNADFFDAEKFPEITFESTGVEPRGGELVVRGNLTIKGVTKEISLPLSVSGPIIDPWGNTRIGLEGSTTIKREDFGITWSKMLDNGGLVVGSDVKLEINVEAIKKQ